MLHYYAVGITSAHDYDGGGGTVSWFAEVMKAIVPSNLNVTIATQGG